MKVPTAVSLLLFSSALVHAQKQTQDVCHALVMSGGGNKGAYEAAVVYQMAHQLPPEQITWDVVSGVSAGALNAAGISVYAVGNEVEMSEWLLNLWSTLKTDNLWKLWPEGLIKAINQESSIFDDSPLYDVISQIINKSPKGLQRRMVVSTVDTQSGEYKQFTEAVPIEELPTAIISSASIPGVFPVRKYQDQVFMDGGTVWNTNLVTAVNRCLEIVDDKSKIVMDIAICGHDHIEAITQTNNTISNILRHRQIKQYYSSINDIVEYLRAEPEIQYRYLFIPSQSLLKSQLEMLFLTPSIIQPMIDIGKADAQNVIALGEGKVFEMLFEWQNSEKLQAEYQQFHHYIYSSMKKAE